MYFMEAVEAMKEGKKVKRKYWIDGTYLMMHEFGENYAIQAHSNDHSTESAKFSTDCFEATDWEVVEEKKTLSQKKIYCEIQEGAEIGVHTGMFDPKDIKAAIKDFIDWATNTSRPNWLTKREMKPKAKEIFGEDLI